MGFLHDLFSENSNVSSMRVMSMMSLSAGIFVACYGLYIKSSPDSLAVLSGVFVAAAFGGKVTQKAVELRSSVGSAPNQSKVTVDNPDA